MKNIIKKHFKTLLALGALAIGSQSSAFIFETPTSTKDLLIEFKNLQAKHKAECLDLMAKSKAQYFKLVKAEGQNWSKFGTKTINQLASAENQDQTFRELLKEAIALQKKETADWRKEHQEVARKIADLESKYDQDISAFEQKFVNHITSNASRASETYYNNNGKRVRSSDKELLERPAMTGYGPDLPSQ